LIWFGSHSYLNTAVPHIMNSTIDMLSGRMGWTRDMCVICHYWNPMDKTRVWRYRSSGCGTWNRWCINQWWVDSSATTDSNNTSTGSRFTMNSTVWSPGPDQSCFLCKIQHKYGLETVSNTQINLFRLNLEISSYLILCESTTPSLNTWNWLSNQ
jgi:hypothetical protein